MHVVNYQTDTHLAGYKLLAAWSIAIVGSYAALAILLLGVAELVETVTRLAN